MNCRETIYVPVDTQVFMRPILSRAAAEELIDCLPEDSAGPRGQPGLSGSAQQYRGFLETHRCEDLVQLIKLVYAKNQHKSRSGKKPSKVDQDYQKPGGGPAPRGAGRRAGASGGSCAGLYPSAPPGGTGAGDGGKCGLSRTARGKAKGHPADVAAMGRRF